jgi:hypothetical protein
MKTVMNCFKLILLSLLMFGSAAAMAQYPLKGFAPNTFAPNTRAWLSAGTSCNGGSIQYYTDGQPVKVSLCVQTTAEVCGLTVRMEADLPEENGKFALIGRTLNKYFDDPNSNFPAKFYIPIDYNPVFFLIQTWAVAVDLMSRCHKQSKLNRLSSLISCLFQEQVIGVTMR